jgi:CRISPR-associated protein Csm4
VRTVLKIVRIKPKSQFRIGGLKGFETTDELIHSDTIFGALTNAIAYLNLDVEDFISRVRENEVKISSAMPYNNGIFFPPPPIIPIIEEQERTKDFLKEYRKSYLSQKLFEKILSGETISAQDAKKELLKFSDAYKVTDVTSVTLDRERKLSNLYLFQTIYLKNDFELCILLKTSDYAFKQFLKPGFKLLADEGLGGNRSTGFGCFNLEFEDLELRISQKDSEVGVTLSLSIVDKDKMIAYDLVRRSGWIFSRTGKSVLKPLFFMLKEGSVIRRDEGRLIDLDEFGNFSDTVGHKVYVYAKAYFVPMSEIYFGD